MKLYFMFSVFRILNVQMGENNMDDLKERKAIAVTKLEMQLRKFLKEKKKEMLGNRFAREQIEKIRKEYVLQDHTFAMFNSVGMTVEYTNLLNDFNRVLDGVL